MAYNTLMPVFITICMFTALAAVVAVLGLGVFSMAKGGEFNKKYGNRLMRARLILQGVAVALFLLVAALGKDF
ncbi:MAG: twin transmembrane helix small protein [Alphaproteobacteria bacterium]